MYAKLTLKDGSVVGHEVTDETYGKMKEGFLDGNSIRTYETLPDGAVVIDWTQIAGIAKSDTDPTGLMFDVV